jgi:hypothetical protein
VTNAGTSRGPHEAPELDESRQRRPPLPRPSVSTAGGVAPDERFAPLMFADLTTDMATEQPRDRRQSAPSSVRKRQREGRSATSAVAASVEPRQRDCGRLRGL